VTDFAVTAIGRDRPGIVAAVSRALLELGGNLEDSQMSILRGHFAVMLIVRVPDSVSSQALEERLGGVREELDLEAITFNPIDELEGGGIVRPSHMLTVHGADHPGIVHAVSWALAELGVNITDLETRVGGGAESPVYAMQMEIALGDADPSAVEAALNEVGEHERIEVSMRPLDSEPL
jgi:glycine cleavage system transcriptional repressor